ncbi:hypothetical protein GJ699_23845 [Duganella sp. FT80W]|uniref:O-antigen ligase domain-containing protein n=1 Tax=Duganella guangzhouensis TaxID=2666084 RepID=A0A6I2L8M8_9BURK|nr:hypothetical protein [Duganella guangzhouensis]MRW93036.1 hypothetical protein [Duganella guangzhouensis]
MMAAKLRQRWAGASGARRPARRFNWGGLLLVFGGGLMAVFFGLLSVTENPILIGAGVALVLGPLMLLKPDLTVWIILVVGFLMGILSASQQLSKLAWIVSMLSTLLLLPALVNLMWSKERRLPGFMQLALGFLFYSLFVSAVNWYSLAEFVGGFKHYFQTFGFMLALTLIVFTPAQFTRWRKFLLIAGLLQFPFALYELLILVPMRGGIALSSETTDVVAGTFGANLQGGSPNSVMVIFLLIVLGFLAARWRAGMLSNRAFYILGFICLLPLGMGETKFAVVVLPMVGLSVLRVDLMRHPVRYLPTVMGIVAVTMVLGYIYVVLMMHSTLSEVIESTMRYNVGNQSYSHAMLLNRSSSITFWFQQQSLENPISFLIGNGLGSSFTSSVTVSGHMGVHYAHYGINLTALSTILWDCGIIGAVMYSGIFIAAWFAAGRLYHAVDDAATKADALAIQAANTLFMFSLIYSDSIVNLVSMELVYSVVLGYLGFLMNQHGLLGAKTKVKTVAARASVGYAK